MNLEFLPNEMLLDLFEYLNSIDLLRAFYDLNSRFNFLLYNKFPFYYFKFDCISKRDFDLICQQHLPFIANRVTGLSLSDDKETPGEMNLFLSYIPTLNQFTQLRCVTLSHLHSYQILLKLLDECHYLNSLTHLKVSSCSLPNDQIDFQLILDNIWSLPKLTNCYLSIDTKNDHLRCLPTIMSLSLESVTIYHLELTLNQINQLFEYTPRLKRLSTRLASINNDYMTFPLAMLIDLNISFSDCFVYSKMVVFLQNIPNLRHLNIDLWSNLIDGQQWEHIICNYLTNLKTFRLKMFKTFYSSENIQEKVDRLVDSFRSTFWINDHQWFVRCFECGTMIHLFTVSQLFNWFPSVRTDLWRSTDPQDDLQFFPYNNNNIYDETFFDEPIPAHIRLSNIENLHIKCPINNQFWSIVPSLNQLHSLVISFYTDTFQCQLQALLDQSPHLHTLIVRQNASLPLRMTSFKCINASIRCLHLHDYNYYFNEEECLTLSRSPLTTQCEVLSIRVKNRQSIVNLVNNLIHLRILHLYWNHQNNVQQLQLTENNRKSSYNKTQILDELVQWLEEQLPSTCLISNDPYYNQDLSIWI